VVALPPPTQRATPDALQGRVSAAITLALFAPQPLANAVGAGAIAGIDYSYVYLAAAVGTLAAGIWLATRQGTRTTLPVFRRAST
jgi:hypothetical protein